MRKALSSAVLALLCAACANDVAGPGPAAADGLALNRGGKTTKTRILEGQCETTFNAPPFPLPPTHYQIDIGTCKFKGLGKAELYGEMTINFAAGTQTGIRTFTFRNGDVLKASNVGTSAPGGPGLVNFQATFTVLGGTGRFENATGQARGAGTANLATRTTTARIFDGLLILER